MPILEREKYLRRARPGIVSTAIASFLVVGMGIAVLFGVPASSQETSPASASHLTPGEMVETYCVVCHNEIAAIAGLKLDGLDATNPATDAEVWERVIVKLRSGMMPPPGMPRPDATTYHSIASSLEADLDRAWAATPNPGRASSVHRLIVRSTTTPSVISSPLTWM